MSFSEWGFRGPSGLHELIKLRSKDSPLTTHEIARLRGLQEFPNNGMACYLTELATLEEINRRPILTPDQREVLRSIILTRKLLEGGKSLLVCEGAKLEKYRRMLNMDANTFLSSIEKLLQQQQVQTLVNNEQFKDMLFQRYSVLMGRHCGLPLMYDNGPDKNFDNKDALNFFIKKEQSRNSILENVEDSKQTNADIPRAKSYSQYWSNKIQVDDSELYHVSHGGGFRFLKLILIGQHEGYNLEHQQAKGIQVHPNDEPGSRLKYYGKYSRVGFDTPAVLTFDIEAGYLDGQPNGYEAGIRSEFLKHGKNFKLENTTTGEIIEGATLEKLREEIQRNSSGIGAL